MMVYELTVLIKSIIFKKGEIFYYSLSKCLLVNKLLDLQVLTLKRG